MFLYKGKLYINKKKCLTVGHFLIFFNFNKIHVFSFDVFADETKITLLFLFSRNDIIVGRDLRAKLASSK